MIKRACVQWTLAQWLDCSIVLKATTKLKRDVVSSGGHEGNIKRGKKL